jgi:hypothetical protein
VSVVRRVEKLEQDQKELKARVDMLEAGQGSKAKAAAKAAPAGRCDCTDRGDECPCCSQCPGRAGVPFTGRTAAPIVNPNWQPGARYAVPQVMPGPAVTYTVQEEFPSVFGASAGSGSYVCGPNGCYPAGYSTQRRGLFGRWR